MKSHICNEVGKLNEEESLLFIFGRINFFLSPNFLSRHEKTNVKKRLEARQRFNISCEDTLINILNIIRIHC